MQEPQICVIKMDTPGKFLKAEREKQQRSLEELAKALKVRVDYLKAIEEENYELIPGEVFIKGYIRMYAEAMGLSSNILLKLYKKQVAKTLLSERPIETRKKIFTHKPALIITGLTLLIIVPLIVFISREEKRPVTELTVVSEELRVIVDNKEEERFSLEITAIELTWISVEVDNDRPVVRFLKPGEIVRWTALNGFSVKIGNAAGAELTFNGKSLGNLGPRGKVVNLILPGNDNIRENEG